jgi:hypothetical protein
VITLNRPSFVMQRRINQPHAAVERVLCDPRLLRAHTAVDLGVDEMYLELEERFRVAFPPFGLDRTSWQSRGAVCTRRGRTVVGLELEINRWDARSAELLVRPDARHPERWSGPRLRRYFRVAHASADCVARLLADEAGRVDQTPSRASNRPDRIAAMSAS